MFGRSLQFNRFNASTLKLFEYIHSRAALWAAKGYKANMNKPC